MVAGRFVNALLILSLGLGSAPVPSFASPALRPETDLAGLEEAFGRKPAADGLEELPEEARPYAEALFETGAGHEARLEALHGLVGRNGSFINAVRMEDWKTLILFVPIFRQVMILSEDPVIKGSTGPSPREVHSSVQLRQTAALALRRMGRLGWFAGPAGVVLRSPSGITWEPDPKNRALLLKSIERLIRQEAGAVESIKIGRIEEDIHALGNILFTLEAVAQQDPEGAVQEEAQRIFREFSPVFRLYQRISQDSGMELYEAVAMRNLLRALRGRSYPEQALVFLWHLVRWAQDVPLKVVDQETRERLGRLVAQVRDEISKDANSSPPPRFFPAMNSMLRFLGVPPAGPADQAGLEEWVESLNNSEEFQARMGRFLGGLGTGVREGFFTGDAATALLDTAASYAASEGRATGQIPFRIGAYGPWVQHQLGSETMRVVPYPFPQDMEAEAKLGRAWSVVVWGAPGRWYATAVPMDRVEESAKLARDHWTGDEEIADGLSRHGSLFFEVRPVEGEVRYQLQPMSSATALEALRYFSGPEGQELLNKNLEDQTRAITEEAYHQARSSSRTPMQLWDDIGKMERQIAGAYVDLPRRPIGMDAKEFWQAERVLLEFRAMRAGYRRYLADVLPELIQQDIGKIAAALNEKKPQRMPGRLFGVGPIGLEFHGQNLMDFLGRLEAQTTPGRFLVLIGSNAQAYQGHPCIFFTAENPEEAAKGLADVQLVRYLGGPGEADKLRQALRAVQGSGVAQTRIEPYLLDEFSRFLQDLLTLLAGLDPFANSLADMEEFYDNIHVTNLAQYIKILYSLGV
ncbi:MAG: hypothetical protein HYZ90_06770 [Candidatus Omnitrophica bacterium]|nr:hypothetical protein [Candidatus Omnitrophota bacterium]